MLVSVLDSLLFDSLISKAYSVISTHSGWPCAVRSVPSGKWRPPVAFAVSAPLAKPRRCRALPLR
ncbi:hypothetical protein UCMB321_1491 [Pseudomonas batumici]|uniref:Uncharacterized protein n=1 Tax=Pseudomonas batumici TaxID=226910 RepID=A0A0C2I6H7_9PSED|nr:hypothetical protein UCMB321_1491 [Pseudomonas batumici]